MNYLSPIISESTRIPWTGTAIPPSCGFRLDYAHDSIEPFYLPNCPVRYKGLVTVEFAILVPILLWFMFVSLQYGWLLYNYAQVASAAGAGARFFVTLPTRGGSATSYGDTQAFVRNTAPKIGTNLAIATKVDGVSCTDATSITCQSALSKQGAVQATVTVTWSPIAPQSSQLKPA